jgi:type VI secretion system secreted protein VgrG
MAFTQQGRLLYFASALGEDYVGVRRMKASEGLSQLFRIEVELLHEEKEAGYLPTVIDPAKILGKGVTIRIKQKDGTERFFNGMVINFSQGQRDIRFSYYRAIIVPHVWNLTQIAQSRIFQHKNVPDILKEVFKGYQVQWEIQGSFEPRNYCVQYRETDFDFASRLMEEEGIWYYFKHENGKHTMVVANTPQSHVDCPGKKKIAFGLDVTRIEDFVSAVGNWLMDHQLLTGKYSLRDYHHQIPTNKLKVEQPSRFNIGNNQHLEFYEYPGGYSRRFDGIDKSGGEQAGKLQKIFEDNTRTVKIRQEEIDAQHRIVRGTSDCCSFTAGNRFELFNHPNKSQNGQHVLVTVEHDCMQSPSYETGEEEELAYNNDFTCMPYGANQAPYRPPRKTPKPLVRGSQTAIVVGPSGEEIFTDKYGRVKVQFHWDREGEYDANSSCWLRVAQNWAGKRWGMMFIPRVGMEVIVDFLEGDPDQPIITGCVYNAETMPPYTLPDEKTKMTVKSDSSKGGGGFNEIRFEDKKGSEQVFLHGQKDQDIRIKNDRREWIGRDRHLIVKRDKKEKIERDVHTKVTQDVIEEIGRDHHLKVKGKVAQEISQSVSNKVGSNFAEEVGGNYAMKVSGNYTVEANMIVLKAQSGLTICVGGNYVTINPAGVQINGTMVLINSGGAALPAVPGVLVPPMSPQDAEIADNADPGSKAPTYKNQRAQLTQAELISATAPTHNPETEENKKKKSWIEIKLVDEDGNPVPGERYRITLPDGKTLAQGVTDEKGEARVDGIDPGNCKITFPNLDADVWNRG